MYTTSKQERKEKKWHESSQNNYEGKSTILHLIGSEPEIPRVQETKQNKNKTCLKGVMILVLFCPNLTATGYLHLIRVAKIKGASLSSSIQGVEKVYRFYMQPRVIITFFKNFTSHRSLLSSDHRCLH